MRPNGFSYTKFSGATVSVSVKSRTGTTLPPQLPCRLLDQVGCHKPYKLARRYDLGFLPESWKMGSPQESDEVCILCGLLKSNEFGLGKGQSLCFEQQIVDVAIAATAAQ